MRRDVGDGHNADDTNAFGDVALQDNGARPVFAAFLLSAPLSVLPEIRIRDDKAWMWRG